jgi:hypothetical protein
MSKGEGGASKAFQVNEYSVLSTSNYPHGPLYPTPRSTYLCFAWRRLQMNVWAPSLAVISLSKRPADNERNSGSRKSLHGDSLEGLRPICVVCSCMLEVLAGRSKSKCDDRGMNCCGRSARWSEHSLARVINRE